MVPARCLVVGGGGGAVLLLPPVADEEDEGRTRGIWIRGVARGRAAKR